MKDKKFLIVGGIILLVIILIVGIIISKNSKQFELNLPKEEDIQSIKLEQNNQGILLSGKEEIQEIFSIIKGENRITSFKSENDIPVDGYNVIKIDFNYEDSIAAVVYIYFKDDAYFIEQPYNGIYPFNEEEFNIILSYFS